jgi:cysteine synthase
MYFKFASVVLFALATNGFAIPAPTSRTVETSLRSAVEPEISTQIQTQGANNVLPTGRLRDQTFPKGLDLIGNTPVCDITAVCKPKNPKTRILGKCEMFNPGYSMKDRIVKHIFTEAEISGKLKKGMTVVAASSGNTGCSVAMMCALKGYDCVIITNSKCSEEKCASIRAYGAKLLISEPGQDYMQMELDLADENPTWFSVNQYNNLDNPGAHFASTGPEIWEQTHGLVTDFVAAGSTGGTVSGTGGFLKSMNPNVKIHLADPNGSIFAHYKETGEV